jgi:hypothetical protein
VVALEEFKVGMSQLNSTCCLQEEQPPEGARDKDAATESNDELGEGEMDAASIEEQKAMDNFAGSQLPDPEIQLPDNLDLEDGEGEEGGDEDAERRDGEGEGLEMEGQEAVCEERMEEGAGAAHVECAHFFECL